MHHSLLLKPLLRLCILLRLLPPAAMLHSKLIKTQLLPQPAMLHSLLLKALLRAVTTAFVDFVEVLSSPTRVLMLVLFTMTGVAAPVVKAASQLAVDHLRTRRRRRLRDRYARCENGDSSSGEDDDPKPNIVMQGAPQTPAAAAGSRLLQMVGRRRPPIRTPSYVDYTDSTSGYGSH